VVEGISVVIYSYQTNNDKAMPTLTLIWNLEAKRLKNLGTGCKLAHLVRRWV
jgi:hypothetical protein